MLSAAQASSQLRRLVEGSRPLLRAAVANPVAKAPLPGKWTQLELLGHLVDSASNNHQRIVRALAHGEVDFPGYQQEEHVRVQRYAGANADEVIALWSAYNLHLAWVVQGIPVDLHGIRCMIDGSTMTLQELVSDYVAHLEHHLRQLLGSEALVWSGLPWPPAPGRWPL